jgi:predicted nucleotidyltransferase component of viral defense system
MIKPGEIQQIARKANVRDQQIEKDYVLSWLLQGIAQHDSLSDSLIFKGGTLLKKVYFDSYRFSEDLDFTLLFDNEINDKILDDFKSVFEYISAEANIPLEITEENEHQDGGFNFYINYVGPLGGQGKHKSVKVDISGNEKLVFEARKKQLIVSYSDQIPHQLHCYSLEEVLVEKMRSVMQRMQPRDFYDIWYLLEVQQMDVKMYSKEFSRKCENKAINPDHFSQKLTQRLPQYRGRWVRSMADQIQALPDFEQVEREVLRCLKKVDWLL